MKILGWFHMAAPLHGAGAEWMAHHLLAAMVSRGHQAEVAASYASGAWTLDGVCCHGEPDGALTECLWEWCDVAVTHLDMERQACNAAQTYGKPLVHLVHNQRQLHMNAVPGWHPAIFNSHSLHASSGVWPGPAYIIPPPVDPDRYRVEVNEKGANLLVNLSADKGAKTFYALARELPEQQFLGVMGAYGTQLVERHHRNVRILPQQADMRKVYRQARVVLMPSVMETYGRVGIEAAVSGIPTIAHPTPGLVESLGAAGMFIDRDDVKSWAARLRHLQTGGEWRHWSRKARRRAAELDPDAGYDLFEQALEDAGA